MDARHKAGMTTEGYFGHVHFYGASHTSARSWLRKWLGVVM
jgi:hypothetical protein